MNKKLFLGMIASTGLLLATSCSNDEIIASTSGDTAHVSFTINTDAVTGSRAIADGTTATKLYYGVYLEGQLVKTDVPTLEGGHYTLHLDLVKGQTYELAFWAQADGAPYVVTIGDNKMEVEVLYAEKPNNAENRDAFTAHHSCTINGDINETITLTRPLAQINVGINAEDYNAAKSAGVEIVASSVELKGTFGSVYNVMDGTTTTSENVTYTTSEIPADSEILEVAGTDYKYLSTCYVLPANAAESQTVDAKFTFVGASNQEIVLEQGLDALPIQSNYRTNILGNVLTNSVDFDVVIDAEFKGETNVSVWNGDESSSLTEVDGVYHITSAADFALLMKQTQTPNSPYINKTFVLDTDLNFGGATITGIGSESCNINFTFDGNGHTISNYTIHSTKDYYAGLFNQFNGTVKNLTVKNATVTGVCMVGAIASNGDAGAVIENCHAVDCTIAATEKKAGAIVGYIAGATVKDCSATNCVVYCASADAAQSGEIVGYENTGCTVSGNNATNVEVITGSTVIVIASAADFKNIGTFITWGIRTADNVNIVLVQDIELKDVDLMPLELTGTSVLNGNGHKLTNVTPGSATGRTGLLWGESAGNVTVKNLTIDGVIVDGKNDLDKGGKFASVLFGDVQDNVQVTIENVHIYNATVKNAESTGGFVGFRCADTNSSVTIKNSSINNSTIIGTEEVGKIGALIGRSCAEYTCEGVVINNVNLYNNTTALTTAPEGTKSEFKCTTGYTIQ